MANKRKAKNRLHEIVRRLNKSVQEFNDWRVRYPGVYIELGGYDFSGKDLRGVNLCAAKLKKATLSTAILCDSDFRGANLNDANLIRANCSGVDMRQCRLAGANLSGAILEGANLYATIRDGWKLDGVVCRSCWITKDREQYPEAPDVFEDGEFEIVYGGRRIQLRFPDGFQPIDLLALPYHARNILERFQGKRIIFMGMSSVGNASLEFRVENMEPPTLEPELQKQFTESVTELRNNAEGVLRALLVVREEQIRDQRTTIDTLSGLLAQESQHRGRGDIRFLVGGDLYISPEARAVGRGASADEFSCLTVWNELATSTDLGRLSKELSTLRKALEGQSRTEEADQISVAEKEIEDGNGPKALRSLKKAGKWALETATKIGTEVAAAAIKKSLGVP